MTMTRTPFRPVAAVGLVAMILIYVGCSRPYEPAAPIALVSQSLKTRPTPAEQASGTKAGPRAEKAEGKDPLRLFADWMAKPPAGVLLISGEQDGYLQPCGCTDGQLGGLGRRYDFAEKLRAKGWPVAGIDLGNLIHDPAGSRGGPAQERIKFDIALKALDSMKYEAVALGPEDLKLGVGELLGMLLNLKSPRFLASNVKAAEGFEATLRSSATFKAGPVTVGAAAILDPAAFEALNDPDKAALLAIRPADAVLPGILAGLEKASQIQILMVQGPIEEGRRLAGKFPGFDLVVTASKFDDPDERPESLNGGKTLLINVGRKGKYVGVIGFFPGSTPAVRYKRQALGSPEFREAEPIRRLVDVDFQDVLRSVGVVENITRHANVEGAPGATYAGAESCCGCHPKTFEKWASTKHARAYEVLTNPRRNREHDAECISCHTTGFTYTSGWVSAEKTPYLKGNQCENCHGPGSLHNAEPDNLAYRKPMARTADFANRSGFCTNCHNEDNDHNFTFDARYAQIFHKGLDTYDDPKVHQARPAKVARGNK